MDAKRPLLSRMKGGAAFLLPLLTALTSACAHGGRASSSLSVGGARPAWVDGESPRWPRSAFVLGVGSADDENTAVERARGEVARVFSATISVDTSVSETESTKGAGGKQARAFSQEVAETVRSATQKVLEGLEIVARWKDPSVGRTYALAALDKAQALLSVEEKLHELDQESARYQAQLAQASDRFERAKAAAKLLALAKPRAELDAERRVLGDASPQGGPDAGAVRADAAKALAALDVVVAAGGEGADEVTTGVISGLNAAGMTAKSGAPSDKCDLMAQTQVAVQPADAGDPRWQRSRATASVSLQDGREGKTFARFDLSAREDSADAGEARRRALATLAKKTSDSVTQAIKDFFANQ